MNTRIRAALLPAAFFLLLLLPCRAPAEPLSVAVSIPPQKYFVDRIAGDAVKVTVMVARGGDPHSYEPTASGMAGLSAAKVYFAIGLPFEAQWLPRFQSLAPGLAVIRPPLADKPQPGEGAFRLEDAGRGGHAHEHEAHGDPHLWLSPEAMRELVPQMRDALIRALPGREAELRANCEGLLRDMAALETRIKALFAPLPPEKRRFLTFHHAWGWYAHNFGLTETSVEYEGKEPGPRGMAAIIGYAKQHGVRCVLVSPGTNRASAEAVASSIGGGIVEADPLDPDWSANLWRISSTLAARLAQ